MTLFISHMGRLINKHKFALFLAIFIGILFLIPPYLARIDLGDKYHGAPFLYQSDDENYLTNIQEVIDGHLSVSSPVYSGYKDSPSTILPLGEYLYAFPVMILHISVLSVITATKFIFPALLFLLVYYLVYLLVREHDEVDARVGAIAGALLVVFGYDFVSAGHIISILHNISGSGYSSIWARLVNPISGALLLFLLLIVLWKIINKSNRFLPYVGGVLIAMMVGYFFSYALALSISFALLIIMLFKKRGEEARSLLVVLVVGVLPVIPKIFALLQKSVSSANDHAFTKIGLFYTHTPLLNKFLLLALFVFVLVSLIAIFKNSNYIKTTPNWWLYCFALLAGTFLAFMQQIISGITIWPQHFVQYSIPIVYVVGIVSLYKFVRPLSRKIWNIGMWVIILASLSYGVIICFSYRANMENYLLNQRYVPIYKWLNNTPMNDGCVVLASEDENYISSKIPAYTHCDVFYSVYNYYGVPQKRVERGYLAWLRIREVSASNVVAYLNAHRMEVRSTMFTNWLQLWHDSGDSWLKSIQNETELTVWEDNAVDHLADSYRDYLKVDFGTELKQDKLDYVIWDREKYPKWNIGAYPFLEKVYEANNLVVFALKP